MSYILDALRRAQSERERGRLPGLQTQPAVPSPTTGAAVENRLRGRELALAGLLLAAAVAGAWWWHRQTPASPPAAVAVVPQGPPPAAPAPVPAPAAPAATLPIVVSAPPAPPAATPPAAPREPPAAAPPSLAATPTAPVTATTPPAAAAPPTQLAALPPELRRELPPLEIGGSVWSENPASRFVIVNGQLVHEGQAAAPGVVVERIAQRSAVLRWRALRIEVPL